MKTIAVIPCHNEEKHIAGVVTKARQYVDEVWVIDDNSTDDTYQLASNAGAHTIRKSKTEPKGYGASIRLGILSNDDADIIVLLDGDGQHSASDIPGLIAPIIYNMADVVIGQRLEGNMPTYRRFGNKVLTAICNTGARFKPSDALCGYWAVSVEALPKLTEDRWGMAVELLVKARSNGCRLMAMPVQAIYHDEYSDNSATSPVKLGLALLWAIIKWRIKVEVLKR